MVRVGIGYDSHRFVEGRPLVLGGVTIPFGLGLAGHSDADAITHALIDAILGAAGMGDIGTLYPDNEARWKDAHSIGLLRDVRERLRAARVAFRQADITVIAERPKLLPYRAAMQQALAGALEVAPERIGLKGKTNEGMGFIGRGEGVAVFAVATVEAP